MQEVRYYYGLANPWHWYLGGQKSKAKRTAGNRQNLKCCQHCQTERDKLTKTDTLTDFFIPAILSFLTGLTPCCACFTSTKTELSELREKGMNGQESIWKKKLQISRESTPMKLRTAVRLSYPA